MYILGVRQNVIIIRIIIHLHHIIIKVREHDLNLGQCTGKHHRLHDTVLLGFSYLIVDTYGIPGSKQLLAYTCTVPYYRKW